MLLLILIAFGICLLNERRRARRSSEPPTMSLADDEASPIRGRTRLAGLVGWPRPDRLTPSVRAERACRSRRACSGRLSPPVAAQHDLVLPSGTRNGRRRRFGHRGATGDELVERFRQGYAFPLDPFQASQVQALARGDSALVAAPPTGSGKTVGGEFAVDLALQRGQNVSDHPDQGALESEGPRTSRPLHGTERVGLLTGDNTINMMLRCRDDDRVCATCSTPDRDAH